MAQLPFETLKREVFEKKKSSTEDKFGKYVYDRSVEELIEYGVVNIDKPRGPTSHQVSAYVQKILGIGKAGHSGTLDPNVTGVLPIALGRATRIVESLLKSGKEYIALMHLHREVPEQKIKDVCKGFTGRIKQLPPIKSSVKRQWRLRNVYYIDVLEVEGKDVLMRVGCEAGTYIRKLCSDMGEKLGTGAHMAELRRTKAGCFDESTLITLQELTDAFYYYKKEGKEEMIRKVIMPMESACRHLPKIWVMDTTVDALCHGASLKVPGIVKLESEIQPDDVVAVFTLKNELVCLGKAVMDSKEMLKKERGVAVKTDKVFMNPGTYPRVEKK